MPPYTTALVILSLFEAPSIVAGGGGDNGKSTIAQGRWLVTLVNTELRRWVAKEGGYRYAMI